MQKKIFQARFIGSMSDLALHLCAQHLGQNASRDLSNDVNLVPLMGQKSLDSCSHAASFSCKLWALGCRSLQICTRKPFLERSHENDLSKISMRRCMNLLEYLCFSMQYIFSRAISDAKKKKIFQARSIGSMSDWLSEQDLCAQHLGQIYPASSVSHHSLAAAHL